MYLWNGIFVSHVLYVHSNIQTGEDTQLTNGDEEKIDEDSDEEISEPEQFEYDGDDVGITEKKGTSESCNIYSEATKNVKEDVQKGESIRNQLG